MAVIFWTVHIEINHNCGIFIILNVSSFAILSIENKVIVEYKGANHGLLEL